MKKVPTATCAFRDRWIVSIERVYTQRTFYMKSAVLKFIFSLNYRRIHEKILGDFVSVIFVQMDGKIVYIV